jgi:hypothetical protein
LETVSAETVAAPPAEIPEDDNASIARARREHLRVYEWTRPNWGIQLTGSHSALGGGYVSASTQGNQVRGLTVHGEWQPEWIQAIGVLGIGPSLGLYPIVDGGSIRPTGGSGIDIGSNWSVGGQVRYQLRLFHEQPLVPVAGYALDYLSYHLPYVGTTGRMLIKGPFFGAMLFLNFLEPSAAVDNYVTNGISRTYLVAELRIPTGGDGTVEVGDKSYFFGLRFEF